MELHAANVPVLYNALFFIWDAPDTYLAVFVAKKFERLLMYEIIKETRFNEQFHFYALTTSILLSSKNYRYRNI
jgi:hypothetical protein